MLLGVSLAVFLFRKGVRVDDNIRIAYLYAKKQVDDERRKADFDPNSVEYIEKLEAEKRLRENWKDQISEEMGLKGLVSKYNEGVEEDEKCIGR